MSTQSDPNEYIYKALTEHMMERFKERETQKALAYRTAIGNLQYYFPNEAIVSVKGKRINGRDVPGIGPSIATRIKEIIENSGVVMEDVPHIEIPTLETKTTKPKNPKGYTPDILKSGPLLAKLQPTGHDPTGWWMSEKLDGYRAIWDGKEFYSRNGKVFESPAFFKDLLPTNVMLDGELWLGRGRFEEMGFVRNKYADAKRWKESGLTYMVYDIPSYDKPFEKRMIALQAVVETTCEEVPNCPLRYVKQTKIKNPEQVKEFYNKIVNEGGEGVMLRQPASKYVFTRSGTLLKVKPVIDAECTVIGYKEGAGKNKYLLGSFHCEMGGKKFYVGTGISDELRREKYRKTHPTGSLITIQYTEMTKAGIPRFPRYVRKRGHVSGKRHLTIKDFPPRGDEVWETYDNVFEYMHQRFKAPNPPKTAHKNKKVLCDYLKKIVISEVDVPV
jgi:ATP-dependent DNA ligase